MDFGSSIVKVVEGVAIILIGGAVLWALSRIWKSRIKSWVLHKLPALRHSYGIWRTERAVQGWFGTTMTIRHLSINQYNSVSSGSAYFSSGLSAFSFMELKQPFLSPRLSDYFISKAIERLTNKGKLVKLPQPRIGGTYSSIGNQPAQATAYTIAFNEDPKVAGQREADAEQERCCIECHYWGIAKEVCNRKRYAFDSWDETEGNRTTSYNRPVLQEGSGECLRCWEHGFP